MPGTEPGRMPRWVCSASAFFIAALVCAAATAVAGPTTAGAATVSVSGGTLTYQFASINKNNVINVDQAGSVYRVRDLGGSSDFPTPGPGCSGTGLTISCPVAGVTALKLLVGSGLNTVTNETSLPATFVGGDDADHFIGGSGVDSMSAGATGPDTLEGNGGDDVLTGSADGDSLYGGDGDDYFDGWKGADLLDGGDGTDTAGYPAHIAPGTQGVIVTIGGANDDGNALDGAVGSRDNVTGTVENVTGTGAGDQIFGDGDANALSGGAGIDTLQGLGGADTLDGGDDQDALYGNVLGQDVDGAVDVFHCGPGPDSAHGELIDVADADCEFLGFPPIPATVDVSAGKLRYSTTSGDDNDLTVTLAAGTYAVVDSRTAIGVGNGCARGSDNHRVTCPAAGVASLDFQPGGGNDAVYNQTATPSTIDGGAGVDNLNGGSSVDVIRGGSENDVVSGGDGNDVLLGDAGQDWLIGDNDNDTLQGGADADVMFGGTGVNTASYAENSSGITATVNGSASDGDGLVAIQNLTGGSGADTLNGDSGPNTIDGLGGEDTIDGGDGEDQIFGGDDNDTIAARDGVADGVSCGDGSGDSAVVDLAALDTVAADCESIDRLTSAKVEVTTTEPSPGTIIRRLAYTTSEDEANDITTDTASNGQDKYKIVVTDSKANIRAGTGCVSIAPNSVECAAGDAFDTFNDETYDLGAGDDKLTKTNTEAAFRARITLLMVNGEQGDDQVIGGASGMEFHGGAGDDKATSGTIAAADLYGEQGDDSLIQGYGGLIIGGPGADDLFGAPGPSDTVSYEGVSGDVHFDMDGVADDGSIDDESGGRRDNATGFENIYGGEGNDTLIGGPSESTSRIFGLGGNDTIDGGADEDVISGGDGFDTASYESRSEPIEADLSGSAIDDGAVGERDSIASNVEAITGGSGDDILQGSSGHNRLDGNGGGDRITAGSGDDDVDGGEGVDSLFGENGDDTVDAGPGDDLVDGGAGDDGVTGGAGDDVIAGQAGLDTLDGGGDADSIDGGEGADQLHGSSGADKLFGRDGQDLLAGGDDADQLFGGGSADEMDGDGGPDQLRAGDGDDSLDGGLGDDLLEGGLGADRLRGGDGTDLADFSAKTAAVNSDPDGVADDGTNGEGDDVAADVEGAAGGSAGDALTGNDAAGVLAGNAGDDQLDGRGGADAIGGGDGSDTAIYASRAAAVNASLDGQPNDGGAGEQDNLAPTVENIVGGAGDDTLAGSDGVNALEGNGGADTLTGGGGFDLISGGDGSDSLSGGDGNDDLSGGDGNDGLDGGGDNDGLDGQGGEDTLDGGAGSDVFNGGSGVDLATYKLRAGSVTIDLNDSPDDGEKGESDNVRGDVENLETGSGNDSIRTRDGMPNAISCGPGSDDSAKVDGIDSVAPDCENLTVEGSSIGTISILSRSLKAGKRGKVKVRVSCKGQGCSGKLSLKKRRRSLLSSDGFYSIASGRTRTVVLSLSGQARRSLKHSKTLRGTLLATPSVVTARSKPVATKVVVKASRKKVKGR